MKCAALLLLGPYLAFASPLVSSTEQDDIAPVLSSSTAQEVPNSYMIVFKNGVSHDDASEHHKWVQDLHVEIEMAKNKKRDLAQLAMTAFEGLKHTYHIPGRLLGYSGHFDDEVIQNIRKHPQVSIPTYQHDYRSILSD